MGNPRFWYYPNPGNAAEVIDMGEGLAELFSDWEIDAQSAVDMSGGSYRTVGMGREIVTIQRDRMLLGEELAVQFVALQNHLDRGFSCSFSSDADLAYCAAVTNNPSGSAAPVVSVTNELFGNLTGIASMPPSNTYMTLETQPPGMITETLKATNLSGATLTAGGNITVDNLVFKYGVPSFLRYYRFWPILKRPAADVGKNIVTNEHGQLYSLSLRLVVDYAALFAFHPDQDQLVDWALQPNTERVPGDGFNDGWNTLDFGPGRNRSELGSGPNWSPGSHLPGGKS